MPITRPRRFQISKYGGRRPRASRILAMTPRMIIGNSMPRSYSGCNCEQLIGFKLLGETHSQGQDQSCLSSAEQSPDYDTNSGRFPYWPFAPRGQRKFPGQLREISLMIDQSLTPADETEGSEALRLNLNRYVEILEGFSNGIMFEGRIESDLSYGICSKWYSA